MSTLIDALVGMKDAGVAEIAQLGRTMNKGRKDILAYFDRYILRCLIHAANIRHTINALYNRKSHQTGVFRRIFLGTSHQIASKPAV
ncbi:hypothetical protein CIP107580_02122 [Corynebacterium diphtheriae]|uniref:Uncharacterized protein n=1 Tax=Corynebacterium diphtheriae TaxID=1717 RepID=A0A811G6Y0_CORDP|nr:hypothetical protein [Corynebacterium diphtheriae]CAB0576312.1 hypothetical protein CIP107533_02138 [Corynebacterium diphtheriae]CAB0623101.1 hypothetical protein CIP107547_02393 [Corynebacterium diphtheriae]CAB0667074.1 hypothetical protein CIP107563_02110 [Corynebacterium diphtheriae]CAB0667257.1 hypothetical protein CIP107580_02122 [Corynebacterium diphtheriae]